MRFTAAPCWKLLRPALRRCSRRGTPLPQLGALIRLRSASLGLPVWLHVWRLMYGVEMEMFKSRLLKQADQCVVSRQAELVVMDVFNDAKIQLGQVLRRDREKTDCVLFKWNWVPFYIATNLKSLTFQNVTRLLILRGNVLKELKELKSITQSPFLTFPPVLRTRDMHKILLNLHEILKVLPSFTKSLWRTFRIMR